MRGGGTAGGGHWGAAAGGGHWAAGANGHYGSGTYGTTAGGTHYATTSKGGSAEAGNGSWSPPAPAAAPIPAVTARPPMARITRPARTAARWRPTTGTGPARATAQYAYGNHYSGTSYYGGAYHPPTVVNQYYGTGCYNCGGWSGAGAVAAGVAVGTAVGVAAATTANANAAAAAYAYGDMYAALPGGCVYTPYSGTPYYRCGTVWFIPSYGANGLYYRVVAPP